MHRSYAKVQQNAKVSDIDDARTSTFIYVHDIKDILPSNIFLKHLSQHHDSNVVPCSFVGCNMAVWEWVRASRPAQKNARAGIPTSVFR